MITSARGKAGFPFRIQKAARVIGVDVGHEHGVEVVRPESPAGAQVLREPPHRIDGRRASTRIDENRIAVGLDDKRVDRQPRRPSRNALRINPWKSSTLAPRKSSKLMSRSHR